jgi:glyoxylase-like metal-dependent hydrolase (beta-lactamase superfamily II)
MTDTAKEEPSFKRWSIGAVRVTRILEMPTVVGDLNIFLTAGKADILEHLDWLYPDFADEEGNAKSNFQAFVIETNGLRILVDPCIGNDKERIEPPFNKLDGPFLATLAQSGLPRESIDYVLCTHLHVDHCGWNTMLIDGEWVPTFPNAQYLFCKTEYEHLCALSNGNSPAILADSVKPVIDAGLARFIDASYRLSTEVRLEPTPGHTPGHCSVVIASEGSEAIISGDFIHHPVQLAIPDIDDNFCWDHDLARATRRAMLARLSSSGALLLGSHFAGPTGIYIAASGDTWRPQGQL